MRCVDVRVRGCEDEKIEMCRCEDDMQTPTIRRTLGAEALGRKMMCSKC